MKQLILVFLLFNVGLTYGQNCDCRKEFDYLVTKIEHDYAGFNDKVTKENINDYKKFTEDFRSKSQKIRTFRRCNIIFDDWLKFFNDKHLSVEVESNIYFTYQKIDSNAVLLRIPNFEWNSKEIIDSLIIKNLPEITSTPILIIDLRGNGGGTDYSYLELLPLIYTNSYISKGVEWWASQGNIDFFEKSIKEGKIKKGKEAETIALLDSLKKHKNSFVQINKVSPITRDTVYKQPRLVGLIVDDYCASSCEQFILAAKNSSKTTIFGTQTLGVLDYSNSVAENMLIEGCRIRYPMTRSSRLPENPIDNIGIKPDVEINLPINLNVKSDVDEWVVFVNNYLKKKL